MFGQGLPSIFTNTSSNSFPIKHRTGCDSHFIFPPIQSHRLFPHLFSEISDDFGSKKSKQGKSEAAVTAASVLLIISGCFILKINVIINLWFGSGKKAKILSNDYGS
jgi:hypothetical protein